MDTLFYAAVCALTIFGIMVALYVTVEMWNFGKENN